MLSKQIQILISFIAISLGETEKQWRERRERKKNWRTFEKFLANVQCEHTFYQFSDKGVISRTWLNFYCQIILWSKTTTIEEERVLHHSWKLCESCIRPLTFVSALFLFFSVWFLVLCVYRKLPNQWVVALADWWEKKFSNCLNTCIHF